MRGRGTSSRDVSAQLTQLAIAYACADLGGCTDWPPTTKDLEKLEHKAGVIRREPAGGGSDWAEKWFVLWPRPGVALKEYPAKELKDRGGKWLFQFPCGASGGAPSAETVAESPFPIAGAQIAPLPMTGMDTPMIELTLAVRLTTRVHATEAEFD